MTDRIELEFAHLGEPINLGDAVSRIRGVRPDQYLWLGRIPDDTIVYLRVDDRDVGDISREGFKVEILISGSHENSPIWQDDNAYIRLYENGQPNNTILDDTESNDDIEDGWGKYFEVTTDHETGSAFVGVYRPLFKLGK